MTEPLFNRLMGGSIEFVATRVPLRGSSRSEIRETVAHLPRAAALLADAAVDAAVFCCTISGALTGLDHERKLAEDLSAVVGAPVTTTMLSLVEQLESLGAHTLGLCTPYQPELSSIEHQFFSDCGFAVERACDIPTGSVIDMADIPAEDIARVALSVHSLTIQALVLSCMNWRAQDATEFLVDDIHLPILTSHSATIWGIWRMLGQQ